MGNRHIPRLCRACASPMAGQEATCWSCGAVYTTARAVDRTVALSTPSRAGARWDDDGGVPRVA